MLAIVAAVLAVLDDIAFASCALVLGGDAETVARIEAALSAFPDDPTACVAVRAMCDRTGGEITLELQDEIGRSAHRTFASPDGAAAFLISWSRRPLLDLAPIEIATDPPLDPLRGEFHFVYLPPLGGSQASVTTMAAVVRHSGLWRYGGDLRLRGAPMRDDTTAIVWIATDAELTVGLEHTWDDRLLARGELVGGASYATVVSLADVPGASTMAVHAGLRATGAARLTSSIWLEAALGLDVQAGQTHEEVRPFDMAPANPFLHPLRLEIGLLWAP
jgi:hypothetical protein